MADGDSYRSSRVNGKPRPEAALGCALSAGEKGGFAVASPYNAVMLAAGLCAISIAAVAVSVGCVPVVPPGNALVKSVSTPPRYRACSRTPPEYLPAYCSAITLGKL